MVGCGQREAQYGSDFARAEELPEKLGADGTTITVGDPDAPVKVHLYEDPRCPYCEEFETTGGGPQLREAMLERWTRAEYTLASFLDDRVGGTGSKKAVNALRAALEEGKFVEYHEVLYANQPEESIDGFTDTYLLRLADKVEGLRGPEFDAAVRSMKYRGFVTASQNAYEKAGGSQGTRRPRYTHGRDQRQADPAAVQRPPPGERHLRRTAAEDPRQARRVGGHHFVNHRALRRHLKGLGKEDGAAIQRHPAELRRGGRSLLRSPP
ncbi:thioredoxin domain-containing protein [Streptomyces sp. JV178]|uniref:thioredoxin domain-containing protein n=1 Tax=Streptomyces sp. JV178 TaxID=858632 RepID=UPI0027D3255B|nr:thioredoxin domain-containing protein [Streptomyces sp. JV178]